MVSQVRLFKRRLGDLVVTAYHFHIGKTDPWIVQHIENEISIYKMLASSSNSEDSDVLAGMCGIRPHFDLSVL
jgi:hypothetical protein